MPNKTEVSILRLLQHNPEFTRAELAEKMGMSDSSIKKALANLKAAGWIERAGSNKSGRWIVGYNIDRK